MMVGANITGRFDESVFNRTLSCVDSYGDSCTLVNGEKLHIHHGHSIRCFLFSDREVGKIVNGKLILDRENYNFDASLEYFQENEGCLGDDKGQTVYFNPNTNTFDVTGPVYDENGNRYFIGTDGKIDVLQTKLYLLCDYIIARMSETAENSPVHFVETESGYSIESDNYQRKPVCFVKTKGGYSIGFVGVTSYEPDFNCLTMGQYGKDSYLGQPRVIFSLCLSNNGELCGNVLIGENYIDVSVGDTDILNEADSKKLDKLIELVLDEVSALSVDNDMLKRYDETLNLIIDVRYRIPNAKHRSYAQRLISIAIRINDVSDPYALLKLKSFFESDISREFFTEFYTRDVLLSMIDFVNSRLVALGYIEDKIDDGLDYAGSKPHR